MSLEKNRRGQRFTGTVFGKKSIRDSLVEMLNCFYSPKFTLKTRSQDGTSTIISPTKIDMGPLGWTVEMDLTDAGLSGSAAANPLPFIFYQPPGAANNILQMRDGLFGARSNWWLFTDEWPNGQSLPPFSNGDFFDQTRAAANNFEVPIPVQGDGSNDFSPFVPAFTVFAPRPITLLDATDVLIAGFNAGGGIVNFNQINTGAFLDGFTAQLVSFFLVLVDQKTDAANDGCYYNLYGRRFGGAGQQTEAWPSPGGFGGFPDLGIYPLAVMQMNIAAAPDRKQYVTGNQINRYPPGFTSFRGLWTNGNLTGQVFYPGDIVTDDTYLNPVTGLGYLQKFLESDPSNNTYFVYRGQYVCISEIPLRVNDAPHLDASNWQLIGAIL